MNASTFIRTLGAAPGIANHPNHEPSFWLRTQLADLERRFAAGQVLPCRHVATRSAPFAVTALWMPQTLTCLPCAPSTFQLPSSAVKSFGVVYE